MHIAALSTRSRSSLLATLLFLASAGIVEAQGRQIRSSTTTPSFQLVAGHSARFVILDTGSSTVSLPVTLQLFDERGRQLAVTNGLVRPGFPLRLLVNSTAVLGRSSSIGVYARATVTRPEGQPRPLAVTLEFLQNGPGGSVQSSHVAVTCPLAAPEDGQGNAGALLNCVGCSELHIVLE